MTTLAIPGAISRLDLDTKAKGWQVEIGQATRGEAWTDHTNCRIRIPSGDTDEARNIRLHELMHVKVSPRVDYDDTALGLPQVVIKACEEIRVNELVRRMGGNLDALVDGTEKISGILLGHERDDWRDAVLFVAATHGGKAQKEFISGVTKSNPTWTKPLRQMVTDLRRAIGRVEGSWTSTELNGHDMPIGFANVIPELGKVVMAYFGANPDTAGNVDTMKALRRATEGYRPAPTGEWAKLVIGETDLTVPVAGASVSRKRSPATSGVRVGYASRILTDPQRRVFAGMARRGSGVALADLSGSMAIPPEMLEALLVAARGLTVLGYSHRPNDTLGTPNAWVLARNGRRVDNETLATLGNVGNGLDLPALEWANSMRGNGEPLIWIGDGQTTDSADHAFGAKECADFVKRNRVHTVERVEDAIKALKSSGKVNTLKMAKGRVGRAAVGIY